MKRFGAVVLIMWLVALHQPLHAQAEILGDPVTTVRSYFEALGRNDFTRALELTMGAAQARTMHMIHTLQREAHEHQARLELKLRNLQVGDADGAAAPGSPIPIEVRFHFDVVGHKWPFSKRARTLTGTARFYVASSRLPRILDFDGQLE